MIQVPITDQQVIEAENYYQFSKLNGSITNGNSNIYGALGEIIIIDLFGRKHSVSSNDTYDYDLIIDGRTVDIKTKRTTVKPKPYYLCSISNWNIQQKCDFYFFVRILESLKAAYLLGFMHKERYFKKAVFKKKGDVDINGFIFKDDCYNLPISELYKFDPQKIF